MRVLIADDHALVRSGIASLLTANDIDVAGEASSGLEAVEKARRLRPDLVLMDIKMPDCNGIRAMQLIKAENPQARVIMVTAFDDDDDLYEAMKNGAAGYVLKNIKADEFIDLLSRVMRGEVVVSPWIASRIAEELFRNRGRLEAAQHRHDELTAREAQILKLVAGGATNKEIASSLHVSLNTVKYHLRNIMEKLQMKNRAQMAAYGARNGVRSSSHEEG